MFSIRKIGGLIHWRIGAIGGSIYLSTRAKRHRRALETILRNCRAHDRAIARMQRDSKEFQQQLAAIRAENRAIFHVGVRI